MNLKIRLELRPEITALQKLEQHWDQKLSPSKHNPYPLAPKDLVRNGLVNKDNYLLQNIDFGVFCSTQMCREIEFLTSFESLMRINRVMEVLCGGLARDLDWIGAAAATGFKVCVRDISTVAIDNVFSRVPDQVNQGQVEFVVGEICRTLRERRPDSRRTVAYFASQFFQVLPVEKMRNTLGHLGFVLTQWPRGIEPWPRIYVVHPLPEDNTSVEWGDTMPYSQDELRSALGAGSRGKKIRIETLGKHQYFHQCYSFLRIMFDEP